MRSLVLALLLWSAALPLLAWRHDLGRCDGCGGPLSEARRDLGGIKVAMETYRSEFDRYPLLEPTFPWNGLGRWPQPRSEPSCTHICLDRPGRSLSCCLGHEPIAPVRFHYTCNSDGRDFTCVGVGDRDEDGERAAIVFGTNHDGSPAIALPAPPVGRVGRCRNELVPAGEFYACTEDEW